MSAADDNDLLREGSLPENPFDGTVVRPPSNGHSPDMSTAVGTPPRFRVLTYEEFVRLPESDWLIRDVLRQGELAMLYGRSGSGKTFVALDIALRVAAGLPWWGRRVTQGPAVYVAAESLHGVRRRTQAWARRQTAEVQQALQRNFLVVADAPQLLRGDGDALAQQLKTLLSPPRLIVLDTLARCIVGVEENSAKEVGEILACSDGFRKATGATLLLVHHTGKSGEDERGSSALRAASDTMLFTSQDAGEIVVTCAKQKDAEPFAELRLELERVDLGQDGEGQPIRTCVLRFPEKETDEPLVPSDLKPFGVTICEVLRDHFVDAEASFTELLKETKLYRKTFTAHLKDAVGKGYIEKDGTTSKPRYRLTSKFPSRTVSSVPTSSPAAVPLGSHGSLSSAPLRGAEKGTEAGNTRGEVQKGIGDA